MTVSEIVIGDRVLLKSSEFTKEVAKVMGINNDNGLVIVKMSNGTITEIRPQYILKSFGQ